jgi:Fuc2NAc and GlcNAc transferase
MNAALLAVLAAATLVASAAIARLLRAYAEKRSLLDVPNDRSAHARPTPRGGGVGFVIAFLAALAALAIAGELDPETALGIGGAGGMVALIGFWDDHGHVAARWRLLAHFTAAAWLLAWVGLPRIAPFDQWGVPAWIVYTVAPVLVVWLINLYNFMDGIDGIASVEAATTALSGAIIAMLLDFPEIAAVHVVFAAATLGFLILNWPPASIFMGDVGSGFLGIVSAGLALLSGFADPLLPVAWVILMAVFVSDSGLTLLRRALRGERLYEAHRMHAYQHASRRLRSHAKVTASVAVINLLWLLPMAALAAAGRLAPVPAVAIAYLPVLGLAFWWGAGRPATSNEAAPAAAG